MRPLLLALATLFCRTGLAAQQEPPAARYGVSVAHESSDEGVGGTPGVIALRSGRLVGSLPLHLQPGGIGFWTMER